MITHTHTHTHTHIYLSIYIFIYIYISFYTDGWLRRRSILQIISVLLHDTGIAVLSGIANTKPALKNSFEP